MVLDITPIGSCLMGTDPASKFCVHVHEDLETAQPHMDGGDQVHTGQIHIHMEEELMSWLTAVSAENIQSLVITFDVFQELIPW